jgi:hypothetical protein
MHALVCDWLVDNETLLTVLCEVEKMINNRPLAQQCDDPCDLAALTPNTLLPSYKNRSSSANASASTHNLSREMEVSTQITWQVLGKVDERVPAKLTGEAEVAVSQKKFNQRRYCRDGVGRLSTRWMASSSGWRIVSR